MRRQDTLYLSSRNRKSQLGAGSTFHVHASSPSRRVSANADLIRRNLSLFGSCVRGPRTCQNLGGVCYPTHLSLINLVKHEKREKERESLCTHPRKNDRFGERVRGE